MRLGSSANIVAARILAHANAEPKRVRVRVKAFTFEERTPPKEIQLWSVGDNPTDYGVHKWTERSIADVMGRYDARGNPLLIDVEHLGAKTDDEPSVTGGYARLELRAGAPWLVFDWSKYAVEQIASGERRFLSPEYDVDRTTGEIVALYRVSLVADPGTHRARMLAAAAVTASQEENGMDPKLAAIMAILQSVAEPAAAIDAIKSLVASLDGGGGATGDPAAAPADGEMTAAPGDTPAGGGAPPDKDKDKDKMVATAPAATATAAAAAPAATTTAPPAVTPPATSSSSSTSTTAPPSTEQVTAAANAAVLQIANAQRDHLLLTQGDRLDPSIRRWASSQPLAVVQGLVSAAPAKQGAPGRVAATRGEGHGTQPDPKGLKSEELEQLQRSMGTFKAGALEPHTKADGTLVIPTVPPSLLRERKHAASKTAAPAAGKDGK